MKKQLIIIFALFLNSSLYINCSITKQPFSSIFDSIKENLSHQCLVEKPNNLITVGQTRIIWCPKFLCVKLEIKEDNYQKDRLEENQDCRIPFDHEDIAYSLEADHIVLPIQDNKQNLIPRYALCKIILDDTSNNQSSKTQEESLANLKIKTEDNESIQSDDSFYFSSQSPSNASSPIATSAQTSQTMNTSFSKSSNSSRRKSLSQFIEEKGLHK